MQQSNIFITVKGADMVRAYSTIASVEQLMSCRIYECTKREKLNGPHQANLVLIAYASSEGSGEPAHPRSLARTSAARSYKQ